MRPALPKLMFELSGFETAPTVAMQIAVDETLFARIEAQDRA